jgi:hypothetical protein
MMRGCWLDLAVELLAGGPLLPVLVAAGRALPAALLVVVLASETCLLARSSLLDSNGCIWLALPLSSKIPSSYFSMCGPVPTIDE